MRCVRSIPVSSEVTSLHVHNARAAGESGEDLILCGGVDRAVRVLAIGLLRSQLA